MGRVGAQAGTSRQGAGQPFHGASELRFIGLPGMLKCVERVVASDRDHGTARVGGRRGK